MAKEEIDNGPNVDALKQEISKHEEQLLDYSLNVCLLCRKKFDNPEYMLRHKILSTYHSDRLERLRKQFFTPEQIEYLQGSRSNDRKSHYRDRAKERRLIHGQMDKDVNLHSSGSSFPNIQIQPKSKGATLLAKMGWREGTGLGKSNEGRTNIVQIESQVGTAGLGSKHLSYKDNVKKVMYQRYYEIEDETK